MSLIESARKSSDLQCVLRFISVDHSTSHPKYCTPVIFSLHKNLRYLLIKTATTTHWTCWCDTHSELAAHTIQGQSLGVPRTLGGRLREQFVDERVSTRCYQLLKTGMKGIVVLVQELRLQREVT